MPSAIVLAPDASGPEKLAAKEIVEHFALIGGSAAVEPAADGHPAVYIGPALLPATAAEDFERVRDDGFLLYADAENVYVAGKLPRGTLFGCYEYLESLGIRWGGPGEAAEAIGRFRSLASRPEDGVSNPDFPIRGCNCYFPATGHDLTLTVEMIEWMTRRRCNLHSFLREDSPGLTGFDASWRQLADFVHERGLEFALGSHLTWPGLLMYENSRLFEKHPEFFPLRADKRQPSGLHGPQEVGTYGPDAIGARTGSGMSICASNPDVIDLMARNLRTFLDEHPEIDVMGLWPPDTKWEGCECENCRKLVRPERYYGVSPHHPAQWRVTSDILSQIVGELSARMQESHPRVRILTWSWTTTESAPQNVTPKGHLQLDHFLLPCFTHAIGNSRCAHHHLHPASWREWAGIPLVDFGWIITGATYAVTTAEFPLAWLYRNTIDFLRHIGGKAVTACLEIGGRADGELRGDPTDHYLFCAAGVNYHALMRLAWDSQCSLEDLYNEFAEARFGPAADAMRRYYLLAVERFESWQHSEPTPDFLDVWGSSEVRCRPVWEAVVEIWTPGLIDTARELLDEALAVAGRPAGRRRVELERRVFEHTVLMRSIYLLHRARRRLEEADLDAESAHLRESQLRLLAQAEEIDLPKHFSRKWLLEPLWIR